MPARCALSLPLLRSGLLSEAQLEEALRLAAAEPIRPAEAAVRLGFATEEAVAEALASELGLPRASFKNRLLKSRGGAGLRELVPEPLARRHEVLPLFVESGSLAAAVADPTDLVALQVLRRRTHLRVRLFVAARGELLAAIAEFYSSRPAPAAAATPADGPRESLRKAESSMARPEPGEDSWLGATALPDLPLGTGTRGDFGLAEDAPGLLSRVRRRLAGLWGRGPGLLDAVDCSLFAPPEAGAGDLLLIQAFAHAPEQADAARAAALEADPDALRRGTTVLGTRLSRGARLTLELGLPGLEVAEPVQTLVWQGRTASAQFEAAIPPSAPAGTIIGKLAVSQESVPIGEMKFKLKVTPRSSATETSPVQAGEARRFRTAFVSYASQNRVEVLRRVQMLPAAGIHFFQDILDLEPGDRWSERIYQRIEDSDVMFLFWSSAASASEWVRREWSYALEKKGPGFIRPVILEGPPIPPPPPELSALHFNDKVLYFMKAEETPGAAAAAK